MLVKDVLAHVLTLGCSWGAHLFLELLFLPGHAPSLVGVLNPVSSVPFVGVILVCPSTLVHSDRHKLCAHVSCHEFSVFHSDMLPSVSDLM